MASKSFTLADSPDGGSKGPCAKLCMCTCVLAFIGILGAVGIYVYQTSYGNVCSAPELDENGLSNWTYRGPDHIAYACFPGFFLEGESDLVVGKCENATWNPLPPSCNYLPLRIDCHIHNQSIFGNITMWQHKADEPAHIYGRIDYTMALKPQGQLVEQVIISKRTCNVSHDHIPVHTSDLHPHPEPRGKKQPEQTNSTEVITSEEEPDESDSDETTEEEGDKGNERPRKILKIQFKDPLLKAYKKTDLFINIIFVDQITTARLVSVHQENLTLVMTSEDPVHSLNASWSWDKEKKTRGLIF